MAYKYVISIVLDFIIYIIIGTVKPTLQYSKVYKYLDLFTHCEQCCITNNRNSMKQPNESKRSIVKRIIKCRRRSALFCYFVFDKEIKSNSCNVDNSLRIIV